MTTKTTKTKTKQLYAGLSHVERARLLARAWRSRQHDEVRALRDSVTGRDAIDAYNLASRILQTLNSDFALSFHMTRLGIQRDIAMLYHYATIETEQRHVMTALGALWEHTPYPVTESEYSALVRLDRATEMNVAEFLGLLPKHDLSGRLRPELAPHVKALEAAEDTDDDDAADAAFDRLWAAVDDAIKAKQLAKPKRWPEDNATATEGALYDWAFGTSPTDWTIAYPVVVVPALQFYQDDIYWPSKPTNLQRFPDAEAEYVKAQRAALQATCERVARGLAKYEQGELDRLSFAPPKTKKDWERDSHIAEELRYVPLAKQWPDVEALLAGHRIKRSEVRVYVETVAELQEEVFGGEDPLDHDIRETLDSSVEMIKAWDEAAGFFVQRLRPLEHRKQYGDDWQPETEDADYYTQLKPEMLQHVREGWR